MWKDRGGLIIILFLAIELGFGMGSMYMHVATESFVSSLYWLGNSFLPSLFFLLLLFMMNDNHPPSIKWR